MSKNFQAFKDEPELSGNINLGNNQGNNNAVSSDQQKSVHNGKVI